MSYTGATEIKKKLIGKIHLLKEIPGFSAYELAVKHGFEGTEEEWLTTLKGDKGDPGTLESHTEVDALGHRVINAASPEEDMDAATKKYVDDKFVVEKISDFIAATSDDVDSVVKTVHKQGNIVSGYAIAAITNKTITSSDGLELFTIASGYRPKIMVTCPVYAIMDTGVKTCLVMINPLNGRAYLFVDEDTVVTSGSLTFSFTYILA